MNKIKESLNKEINKEIITIFIPFFITLTIEVFFGICNGGIIYVLNSNAMSLIFSTLIIYLIYGILIGITKKLSISTIIVATISSSFLIINQIKIAYTGEVIVFLDINFIPGINGIFQMVSSDLFVLLRIYWMQLIFLIISLILIIRWTIKNDRIIKNLKARLVIILICIIVFIILFIPNRYTKNIFLNLFLDTDEGSYTTSLSYCDNYSLLAGIYGILLNDRMYEPENYNEEELNEILESYNDVKTAGALGTPNIIVVFSESFWDIDKQEDVKFNEEVAPNIKRLKNEGKLIETLSCAYGRLSENIAFELLTGGSLNYFNKGYIPIMSLYKRQNSEKIPSILKELKQNNYSTKIVFGEDYYNSEKAMKKLGFDEYVDVETLESQENPNNISDEYITELIIRELQNKPKNEKIFYMTETIQNHMPYPIEKYENYDISIKHSNLNEEDNKAILSYAQGVYDADKQLNRLYDFIKGYEEPTILIFLGDHLPYLYTEDRNNNAINRITYFNSGNEIENLYRIYNTQALILSNYNIEITDMPSYLSNDLLLTYIVNNMDIDLSNYYKYLYSTTKYLPASNEFISLDINGNKYRTQELEGIMQSVYKIREKMQYKLFIKATE